MRNVGFGSAEIEEYPAAELKRRLKAFSECQQPKHSLTTDYARASGLLLKNAEGAKNGAAPGLPPTRTPPVKVAQAEPYPLHHNGLHRITVSRRTMIVRRGKGQRSQNQTAPTPTPKTTAPEEAPSMQDQQNQQVEKSAYVYISKQNPSKRPCFCMKSGHWEAFLSENGRFAGRF